MMINCGQCRWWALETSLERETWGRCALYGHGYSAFPTLKVSVPGDESVVLRTQVDFGCIQAEAKQPQ